MSVEIEVGDRRSPEALIIRHGTSRIQNGNTVSCFRLQPSGLAERLLDLRGGADEHQIDRVARLVVLADRALWSVS